MKGIVYTYEQAVDIFTKKASGYVARRYRNYGVEFDDASQEIYLWLLDGGEKKVRRWLSKSPQQTTRVYMSMLDVAMSYAEQEKALRAGYDVDDVFWYTPSLIEGLLPLALDESFAPEDINELEQLGGGKRKAKQPAEGGNLLATVLDIRRALEGTKLVPYFTACDADHPSWPDNVQELVDWLGGNKPTLGRRRAISNAHAVAITSDGY